MIPQTHIHVRLWIDDMRWPPDGWIWAKNSAEAIFCFRNFVVLECSFDHDLGGDDTSMVIIDWLDHQVSANVMNLPEWSVHSSNPVGRQNMTRALERIMSRDNAIS